MSPGLKSTKRNGPVPTGLRLVGASRDLSPLYAWKRCFGMIISVPQKGAAPERLVEDPRGVLVLGAGGEVRVEERGRLPPERLQEPPAAAPGRVERPLRLRPGDARRGQHLRGHRRGQPQAEHRLHEATSAQASRLHPTDQLSQFALVHGGPPRHDVLCQKASRQNVESQPERSIPLRRTLDADTPLRHSTGMTTTFWITRSFILTKSAARFTGSSSESAARYARSYSSLRQRVMLRPCHVLAFEA